MGRAEILQDLRKLTGIVDLTPRECWQSPRLPSGVAKGIVVELLGNAKTEWLLELFCANPDKLIMWCEQAPSINPTAIHQRGVGLERIKFVRSFKDLQQPLRIALESQYYPFVVCPQVFDEIKTFQRFSLLAEKSKSTLFLLSQKELSQAWPISLQLEINFTPDRDYQIEIHRQKHGKAP